MPEEIYQQRREELLNYLSEHGRVISDVMLDDLGHFFYSEEELGNPGDDYQVEFIKQYLPIAYDELLSQS